MAFIVFFAWQADRPNNLGRTLIRRALDQARDRLNAELEIQEAIREVDIDQDTQGVAGSPPIAETILKKIRSCDVFVADLTFIPTAEGFKITPNPNVLIEYGYAWRGLSDERIIGIFNEAFGTPEDLPFDLRHKRWPIRYRAYDAGQSAEAQEQRRAARNELAADLAEAIRNIIRIFAQQPEEGVSQEPARSSAATNELISAAPSSPGAAGPGIIADAATTIPTTANEYPWNDGYVGIQDRIRPGEPGHEVRLLDGPTIFLHLKSRSAPSRLSNVQTMQIVHQVLRPIASQRSSG